MSKRYGLYAFVILLAVLVLLVPGRAILDLPGAAPVAAHPDDEVEEESTPVPSGSSSWDDFPDSVDVAIQGVTGGFSPKIVAQTTDSVVESSRGIKANIDNINTYTATYGPLIRKTPKPPQPTLSQRFWRWAARQVFFWD